MNVWDIVKTVGAGVISSVVPGGGLLIGAINEMLPDDKKLPSNATGDDLNSTIKNLSPDQQANIVNKQFDVDMTQIRESNDTLRTMLKADAENPHSTRPWIAKWAFITVAFISIVIVSMWAYAVSTQNKDVIKTVVDGWPFVVAIITPFVGWLNNYFGTLRKEQSNKLNASNGINTNSGLTGILSTILSKR